jgi:glutamine amidotransferase-like uncharacterized protein
MKRIFVLGLLLFQLGLARAHAATALIYIGRGSCDDRCSEAAANVARRAGLEPRFVTPEMIKPEVLKDAVTWIQPGGNAIKLSHAISKKKIRLIRKFVREGGGYVGFCAGAFFADRTVDAHETLPGLGLIPWRTDYIDVDSGEDGTQLTVEWNGKARTLFFNGGGTFHLDDSQPYKVVATYGSGQPATIETTFGAGRVELTGLHPEAFDSWKTDAKVIDPDGRDWDLAIEMICASLPKGVEAAGCQN